MSALNEKNILADRYNTYELARPWSRRTDRDELWFFDATDCRSLLESAELSSHRTGLASRVEQAGFQFLGQFFRQWLMYTDGDEHLRYRSAVVRALRQIGTDGIVENPSMSFGAEFDLIKEFCEPYVWHVLPQLLGLSSEEREYWRPRIAMLVELPGSENPQIETMRLAEVGLREMHEYLRTKPCKLLSNLQLDVGQTPDDLTLCNLVINVIGDGIHPTIAGLGSELFLRITSQVDKRRSELSFYQEAPFQFAARVASRQTSVGGVDVNPGERVVACLAATSRNQTTNSTELPMTFGYGRHACIGRAYAEKCIRAGYEAFSAATQGNTIILCEEPHWLNSIGYRMIEELRVRVVTR